MSKRIFVGISLSKELQQQILQWRKNIPYPISNINARLIEPKNLHITLVPPWEEENVKKIIIKLKKVFSPGVILSPNSNEGEESQKKRSFVVPTKVGNPQDDAKSETFTISFNQIKFGPNLREPKMIWLSGEPPKRVLDLRLKIYKALDKAPDERPFRLHVTLARLKNIGSIGQIGLIAKVDWQMPVEKFVLYESRLLPSGSDYEILGEFKF